MTICASIIKILFIAFVFLFLSVKYTQAQFPFDGIIRDVLRQQDQRRQPIYIERERPPAQDRAKVQEIQRFLASSGFYNGTIDGDYGRGTERAVERFQRSIGERPTGFLTPQQMRILASNPGREASPNRIEPSTAISSSQRNTPFGPSELGFLDREETTLPSDRITLRRELLRHLLKSTPTILDENRNILQILRDFSHSDRFQ